MSFSDRRFGQFSVTREALDDNLGKYIFNGMIPVRVEMDYVTDRLQVTAHNEQFDPVESRHQAPFYEYELDFEIVEDRDITGILRGDHSVFRGIKWTRKNA